MANKNKQTRMSVKERRTQKRKRQRLIVAGIMVGSGLILILLFALPSIINAARPVGAIVEPEPLTRPVVDFNTMGDPNAPVKIVEYSDFQCPFCKRFADEVEQQLIDEYINTGKVFFVYTPYGPAGNYIGPESESSANAAFCAGEQGKFWEYKDFLFANHTGENVGDFTDKRLKAFAESLNLDMEKFTSCVKGKKYSSELQNGISQGRALNVGGTPTFVFNDGAATIVGVQSFSSFAQQIEALLNP
jgi:protein-disulfide isomerase